VSWRSVSQRPGPLTALVLSFAVVLFWTAAAQDTPPAAGAAAQPSTGPAPMAAANMNGQTVAVKPLDDAANPYLGRYGPWDTWAFTNYQAGFNPALYGGGG